MEKKYLSWHPEIWGGLECTINRIGNSFRDQILYSNHFNRKDDIEKFASLGIKKLRYPVLWEHHQKIEDQKIDWSGTRHQLERICSLGITPIAGLVHHGSGPAFTDLLNENFPFALAKYSEKVASEFPWIEFYTPINEPLTTARFSGLYGLWFPHHKNDKSFCKILLNQIKGIVLSMHAIRNINPNAKLVQTEDLAKVHSTSKLGYQAKFENNRSWLTYDILCGKLDKNHPLWNYFISNGISDDELDFFIENKCIPDIAGFNYYITSERYLDDKISNYQTNELGGNSKDVYADVAAVRHTKPYGLKKLLKEAWQKYQLPMALTEVHLNCSREEQLRWFNEAWLIASQLLNEGVNITAITAWALIGAFDWNSLLVKDENHYETGVFHLKENRLYETAMKTMIQSLSSNGTFYHPVLNEKGWWHKSYPLTKTFFRNNKKHPILILGCDGTLGKEIVRCSNKRSINYVALNRQIADVRKSEKIKALIQKFKPWAVINATGYVNVDNAETNSEICFELNSLVPSKIAEICNGLGIQFMSFSTDLVFDGKKSIPYNETDNLQPLNVYGKSKAEGELLMMKNFSNSLIIRTSSFFGPNDKYNFAYYLLEKLSENKKFYAVGDIIISPTYVPHLADACLDLLIDNKKGIWHLTNEGHLSWYDFAIEIAERNGFNKTNIVNVNQKEMLWPAQRPSYSAMQSNKGFQLPSLKKAMDHFVIQKTF